MADAAPVLDMVCMGETLVDFLPTEAGRRVREVSAWAPAIGGSLANVSVGVARLGARSGLVTVVGEDEFGHFLRERLAAEGVDVSHLRQVSEARTGLVFISLDARGERSFTYFRTRSAEFLLGERDVDAAFLARTRVLHWGSNSLHLPEARVAVQRAAEQVREAGGIVSCDPNLRLHAWADRSEPKGILERLLPLCSVVKLSEEEMPFVTGTTDVRGALEYLRDLGVLLPVVTLGEKGAALLWHGEEVRVPAPQVRVLDTTGAGDGFVASFLYGLTRRYADAQALRAATRESLEELATFSCVVGSRVVERLGAVAGLPRADEVLEHMPADLRPR
ncbi:carbohydrate kinase family protein [Hyalangium rubrum]|uniref:Carbohydrate kinase n=1 Tax=Hyalangium rubrum TaxID=3103134 RepID=A0ABU5HC92_9BACT|nr:carbohydrate kinase [Hyalangium sp. s54d21]MDY7230881.1 carbohydrate kinase [Hyalangium sp. s54d21]